MKQTFHYMLLASQALVQKKLLALLKPSGLTTGQPKVLDYLLEHDGASQKEIAQACHIEAGSLTSVLNRMEDACLVRRTILNGNRRTYHIFLTEKGRANAATVQNAFRLVEEELFHDIPDEDKKIFMQVFSSIYDNLLPKEKNHGEM